MNKTIILLCIPVFLIGITMGYYAGFERSLAVGPNTQSTYYLDKLSLINEQIKPVDILFIGDSLTDNGRWSEILPGCIITNHGIQGDNTARLLDRLDISLSLNPKIAFIMIGINDLRMGKSVAEIVESYEKIVEKIAPKVPQVHIQAIVFMGAGNELLNARVFQLNRQLSSLAAKQIQTDFVDVNSVLSAENTLKAEYTHDGLHLNGLGYEMWTNLILQRLSKLELSPNCSPETP